MKKFMLLLLLAIVVGCGAKTGPDGLKIVEYYSSESDVVCANADYTTTILGYANPYVPMGVRAVETNCNWHCAHPSLGVDPGEIDIAFVAVGTNGWVQVSTSIQQCNLGSQSNP